MRSKILERCRPALQDRSSCRLGICRMRLYPVGTPTAVQRCCDVNQYLILLLLVLCGLRCQRLSKGRLLSPSSGGEVCFVFQLVRKTVSPGFSCRLCSHIKSPFNAGFTTGRGYHGRYFSPAHPSPRGIFLVDLILRSPCCESARRRLPSSVDRRKRSRTLMLGQRRGIGR